MTAVVLAVQVDGQWSVFPLHPAGQDWPPAPVRVGVDPGPRPTEVTRLLPRLPSGPLPPRPAPHATAARAPHHAVPAYSPVQASVPAPTTPPHPAHPEPARTGRHRAPTRRRFPWPTTTPAPHPS